MVLPLLLMFLAVLLLPSPPPAHPPGTGPKDDDEWFEGDGDYNKPYDVSVSQTHQLVFR